MEPQVTIKLNDIQSKLNETYVKSVSYPKSVEEIREVLKDSLQNGSKICPAGTLHSMGGQQFGDEVVSIQTNKLNRIWNLDEHSKTIWIEGGVTWPALV